MVMISFVRSAQGKVNLTAKVGVHCLNIYAFGDEIVAGFEVFDDADDGCVAVIQQWDDQLQALPCPSR